MATTLSVWPELELFPPMMEIRFRKDGIACPCVPVCMRVVRVVRVVRVGMLCDMQESVRRKERKMVKSKRLVDQSDRQG
jgi:hypothetical protein